MKKTICIFIVILPLFASAQDDSVSGGVRFKSAPSWSEVLRQAKAENKYIFVDLYATWCEPCKEMDNEVYSTDTVGKCLAKKFISVRVQMDSTNRDNIYVKSWYYDSRQLGNIYNIRAYPSFLFFTNDGILLLKDFGYKNAPEFLRMVNLALSPNTIGYYKVLENYKIGIKDYKEMGQLAIFANNIVGDKALASLIAQDYKENYLDTLTEDQLCTRNNLEFIWKFYKLINSRDKFFDLFYHQPDRVNSMIGNKDWARIQINQTITREEIERQIIDNGKILTTNPDWKKIKSSIKLKYKGVDATKLVLDYQVVYYRVYNRNWRQWARYQNSKIKLYPPKADGSLSIFMDLNMPAWDAFEHCNDKKCLEMALEWSTFSIKLEEPNPDVQFLDTRAELLYKLGRIKEAINQEQKTIDTDRTIEKNNSPSKDSFLSEDIETLAKMKNNLPTWSN